MFKGSIPAVITPFIENKVDYNSLHKVLNYLIDNGSHGLVPCGTTGESPTLSHDEHKNIIEETIKITDKRIPVIAGTGSNNTLEAIEYTDHAEKTGADAALIVTPYYNNPSNEEIYEHYKMIATKTQFPFILYHVPKRTGSCLNQTTINKILNLEWHFLI